jgi:hypothetical protein
MSQMAEREFCKLYLAGAKGNECPPNVLRRHYGEIFAEPLISWYQDEKTLPALRTWDLFQAWFEVEVVEMVFDVSNRPLAAK